MNCAKFLRTHFFTEHIRWLLLRFVLLMSKIYENSSLNLYFLRKAMRTFVFFRCKKTMFPYLPITLKPVIHLVIVSVTFLILHQVFYLIEIYHVGPKFTALGNQTSGYVGQGKGTSGFHKSKKDSILRYV